MNKRKSFETAAPVGSFGDSAGKELSVGGLRGAVSLWYSSDPWTEELGKIQIKSSVVGRGPSRSTY